MTPEQPGDGQLAAAVRQALPSARASLERLVRIPSVSADPAAAAYLRDSVGEVATLLREAGLPEVDVLTAGDSRPAVLGRRPGPAGPLVSPATATSPFSSCSVASSRHSAVSASGTGPPYIPLCTPWRSARTSTVTLTPPRSEVVSAGTSAVQFAESASTTTSARSRSM